MVKKCFLLIMDGWGIGKVAKSDAILNANTPFIDQLYDFYPNSELTTFGPAVGLPEGQMGNSEVGHLNLGAGRIVYQELERINKAIEDQTFFENEALLASINYAKENNKALHLLGLVSDGGIHAHINHLIALCKCCDANGLKQVYIHAFTDGRDTDPKSGFNFIQQLKEAIQPFSAQIASVTGRFYAMDRDHRWARVKKAYDNLVKGNGQVATDLLKAMQDSYQQEITDEFIEPITIVNESKQPIACISDGDAVICFNFRTDRCREITEALTQLDLPEHGMKKLNLHYTTLTEYDQNYENVHVMYHKDNLINTLGEVLAKHGKSQIRAAETEKYPHVTFFFSGGRELPFKGEKRILVNSPKDVVTYDLKPEMSAYELTEAILPEIEHQTADFICLNFANADMVGHTGVWEAAVKAAETVNECVQKLVIKALVNDYAIFLTADHGNSDYLINEDGSPNTAHTLNPVPLFFISNEKKGTLSNGKLGDIAPSILSYMQIPIPEEMTGNILLS